MISTLRGDTGGWVCVYKTLCALVYRTLCFQRLIFSGQHPNCTYWSPAQGCFTTSPHIGLMSTHEAVGNLRTRSSTWEHLFAELHILSPLCFLSSTSTSLHREEVGNWGVLPGRLSPSHSILLSCNSESCRLENASGRMKGKGWSNFRQALCWASEKLLHIIPSTSPKPAMQVVLTMHRGRPPSSLLVG